MNYWWINANPDEWEIYTTPTGDESPTDGEAFLSKPLFKPKAEDWFSDYFSRAKHPEAQEGDIVICYKTGNAQKIVAIGRIRHVHRDEENHVLGCYIEVIKKVANLKYSKARLEAEIPELGINNHSFAPSTMYKLTQAQGLMLLGLTINCEE